MGKTCTAPINRPGVQLHTCLLCLNNFFFLRRRRSPLDIKTRQQNCYSSLFFFFWLLMMLLLLILLPMKMVCFCSKSSSYHLFFLAHVYKYFSQRYSNDGAYLDTHTYLDDFLGHTVCSTGLTTLWTREMTV